MNFTPSRSKVTPSLPSTLPESPVPCPSLPPLPGPTRHLRSPGVWGGRGCSGSTSRGAQVAAPLPLPSPATALLQHIPTFYLKDQATHGLPDPPLFLWRTLPYTLLQMNTVFCVCFNILFNCSLLPVLVTHLPMPASI